MKHAYAKFGLVLVRREVGVCVGLGVHKADSCARLPAWLDCGVQVAQIKEFAQRLDSSNHAPTIRSNQTAYALPRCTVRALPVIAHTVQRFRCTV